MELTPIRKIIRRVIIRGIRTVLLDAVRRGKLKRADIFRGPKRKRCDER